jgi:hypothetical protein
MKCAQHVEFDAVGTCNSCGRGLCNECVAVFTPPLCSGCALAHNKGVSRSLWTQLVLMGVLFVVGLVLFVGKVPLPVAVLFSLMAAFFPPGWNFLGRYFAPSGGYIFPMARWLNLMMQALVAAFVGIIVGPIYLFKAKKELRIIRETQQAASGQQ